MMGSMSCAREQQFFIIFYLFVYVLSHAIVLYQFFLFAACLFKKNITYKFTFLPLLGQSSQQNQLYLAL